MRGRTEGEVRVGDVIAGAKIAKILAPNGHGHVRVETTCLACGAVDRIMLHSLRKRIATCTHTPEARRAIRGRRSKPTAPYVKPRKMVVDWVRGPDGSLVRKGA